MSDERFEKGNFAWEERNQFDRMLADSPVLARKEDRAIRAIHEFFSDDISGYAGVSWGKDSVVTAHLLWRAMGPDVPIVWVKVWPVLNPDCIDVRDEFLDRVDARYEEVEIHWCEDMRMVWRDHGWQDQSKIDGNFRTSSRGFDRASDLFGDRHVSGVRADESGVRKIAMNRWGESTARTCRPIGWWSAVDVFAYLEKHDLPVHPAYAMSDGGILERKNLRVSALGGERGTVFQRRVWEWKYYRDRIEWIRAQAGTTEVGQ